MESWIAASGSDRLKRCVAEGIECRSAYMDERIAAERPGWAWYSDCDGTSDVPRNPPEKAFRVVDEARKVEPEATLRYHVVYGEPEGIDNDGDFVEATDGWRGYTAEAVFLGRCITYGLPEEYRG